jgi:hypothetical protein
MMPKPWWEPITPWEDRHEEAPEEWYCTDCEELFVPEDFDAMEIHCVYCGKTEGVMSPESYAEMKSRYFHEF